jgi:1-acyl-sn-glycerol-3-phosphate acyltransferase
MSHIKTKLFTLNMLMKYLRLLHTFGDAFWILWIKFPRLSQESQLEEIRNWSQRTLDVLGVQVVHDTPLRITPQDASPRLLVANHVSWVDALIIQTIQPSVFVAKAEVKRWPIVGSIATGCGVVFVNRGSPASARNMVDELSNALHQGYCVAGFPEGTSSDGGSVKMFHGNLFETAVKHQIPVQPLAIRYSNPHTGSMCLKAAFIDDIGFVQSLHQVLSASGIHAKVLIGETLSPEGHSRRSLAHLAQRSVSSQLELLSTQPKAN